MLKNITFTAEEGLIQKARFQAQSQGQVLNKAFRTWLKSYAFGQTKTQSSTYDDLMKNIKVEVVGDRITRDEMNER